MPEITRIESTEFSFPLEDVGQTPEGFSLVYDPGNVTHRKTFGLKIHTDTGITGEYVGGNSPAFAQIHKIADYYIGQNPLEREKLWSTAKHALRKFDRVGIGPLDIALWDFAGKYYDAPIHELLGTYRKRFPAYASTYPGDERGGLDSPEAYADYAEECLNQGYKALKIHGWGGDAWLDIDREMETVRAVGERVGDEMDLMMDPSANYETFADALRVGRICDEYEYFWYEDPYKNGGYSQHSHRKLANILDTPIILTEHIRGLESHVDVAVAESTDFVRADPDWDGGITGAMKIARAMEGLGLDVEFHATGPSRRHCLAATRNSNYYELSLAHPDCPNTNPPVFKGDYADEIDGIASDGTVGVPEGPGLGVTYDWEFIEENKLGGREYS